jgi:RHS repeat-associated protein
MPSLMLKHSIVNVHNSIRLVVGSALLLAQISTSAADATIESEQAKLIRAPTAVGQLGPNLFGDNINFYNGALEFNQTDVSLPGNSKLPVMAGRRLGVGSTGNDGQGLFAHWDLDIPRIYGMFSTKDGWRKLNASGVASTARCTNFGAPPIVTQSGTTNKFRAIEFWHGNMMYVPGAGEQEILRRDPAKNTNVPSDGIATPLVTKGLWAIRCLGTLASTTGTTAVNDGGEGFLAISPEGTQYRFDWLVTRSAPPLSKPVPGGISGGVSAPLTGSMSLLSPDSTAASFGNTAMEGTKLTPSPMGVGSAMFTLWRTEVSILPTLVTDRFGNTVRYTYDTVDKWKLLSIASADGAGNSDRMLTFTYVPGSHMVQTVSDGKRVWTYSYVVGPSGMTMLSNVTLPDNSKWDFTGMDAGGNLGMIWMHLNYGMPDEGSAPIYCDDQITGLDSPVVSGSMVHPSGAKGIFTMTPTQHARNGVPQSCYTDDTRTAGHAYQSQWYDMYSVTQKQISGPGLQAMTWNTTYDTFHPGFDWCTQCAVPSIVSVTNPKGEVTRYSFGSTYGVDEGLLKRVDVGWDGSTALQTKTTRYNYSFPDLVGISDQVRGDVRISSRNIPEDRRVVSQQGVDFTWLVPTSADFDKYYRPKRVQKFSSIGPARIELTSYYDNTVKWKLGQILSVTETDTAASPKSRVPTLNTYSPSTGNLETFTAFGRLDTTVVYNADGTLASRKDGLNQTTTYSGYKRGVPRLTTYPTGATESYVVDDIGQITSWTDAGGATRMFGYTMGRISSITPPTGDTVNWNSTSVAFSPVAAWEYGVEPGHWKQTISTGNSRTDTVFDALWRPVFVYRADLGNEAATSTISKSAYDFNGKTLFTSFPKRTYAELSAGTYVDYDALGRTTSVTVDSELGPIHSSNVYSSNFTTTSTNGRGLSTTTSFQVFDTPSETAVVNIASPLGVNINIARDVFGKTTAITRSGGGKSATRSYVYDLKERLCKTIEPETGTTVQDYDLANNLSWRAAGLSLPSSTCDTASVPAASKTSFTYDALNRLLSTSYGDLSPSISRTYTPGGLPLTVNSNGANWAYGYNRKGLLESETLAYGGNTYSLIKTYDANGSVATLKYPDNTLLTFSPNALGDATQVGGFATGVSYHPNGAVKSFTYGNGLVHSMSQNVRTLPEFSSDGNLINDRYTYDANAAVTGILDGAEGITTRSMTYDELDRLTRVSAPAVWGDATYTYDALDNLTSSSLTAGSAMARTMLHNYPDPTTNRLMNITGSADFALNYGYDSQGNIVQRGAQSYVFDQANRMKQATGRATYAYDGWGRRTSVVGTDGTNRIQVYAQDGRLMFAGPSASTKTKYIYLRNHVIAEVGVSGPQYIHTDGLGSPVARSGSDGSLVSRTRYEPFGRTAMGATPTLGFTGHFNDFETGLTYMQQRYYDPLAGRMMSIDPVLADSNTGGSFNRYAYANNSPYKFIDPDGRAACEGQSSTRCIMADTFDPKKSNGQTTTASADIAKVLVRDRSVVAVTDENATEEKLGFVVSGKAGLETKLASDFAPTEDKDGNGGSGTTLPGTVAITHGHMDGSMNVAGKNDSQGLTANLPVATVSHGKVGVTEIVGGRLQFRMLSGRMESGEQRTEQEFLNNQQKNFDKKPEKQ